jgi:4-oxalocrotonate tautomerase
MMRPQRCALPAFQPSPKMALNGCQEVTMPVVHIYMYAGRTTEQKRELVKRISQDFEEVAAVKPESLNILFHDIDRQDWGIRGVLGSDPPVK